MEAELRTYKDLNKLRTNTVKNSVYFVLNATTQKVSEIWVTDKSNVPKKVELATAVDIQNTDGNLEVTGTTINISNSLITTINSALQTGDNISSLVNDANYTTEAPINGNQYVRQDGEWEEVNPSKITYVNGSITNVQEALDNLLYITPDISNFTITPNTVEVGTTITDITLNWNLNKTFTSLSIDNGVGAIAPNLLTTALNNLTLTNSTTYTITGNDSTNTNTASATLNFRNKIWWGINELNTITGTGILNLQNNELATSRQQTRIINGGGKYIWFAFPTSFGTPSFVVNGLPNTAFTTQTISHTNASGNTQSYYAIRTNTIQNGTLTIQIL